MPNFQADSGMEVEVGWGAEGVSGGRSSMAQVGATGGQWAYLRNLGQETWMKHQLYVCPCFVFWGYGG